jgi:hypothetical protein
MRTAAVIIETRPLPNLYEIIQHKHMDFIPKEWDLIIYHSKENEHLVRGKFWGRWVNYRLIEGEMGISQYNQLLTSPKFWEGLEYDKVLIFQSDSELLREGIEEFLQYDYIGASWVWNPIHGGNGGLSLRTPKIMAEICNSFTWDGSLNEDHWICDIMHYKGIGKLAPISECNKFSVEAKFLMGSLGVHAIDKWLKPEQCEAIRNQYIGNPENLK